ncbi:hypothetical protein DPMN_147468 [Dreissena polymorpha]|uniref:SET domain-containing protein n=1 Tax=Dreissena polymorpha TaxID=45954 RepID=A0A9D4J0N2_DREPO|nr:hypothetical protein DPMN_147468 [Dreissena polymorpha]
MTRGNETSGNKATHATIREIINTYMEPISAYGNLPTSVQVKDTLNGVPDYQLSVDKKTLKSFNDIMHNMQRKARLNDCIEHLQKSTFTNEDELENAVTAFLCERQWSNTKLKKQCISKLKVATKERNDFRASRRNAQRQQEQQMLSSVQDQKWPLVVIAGSKHSRKGRTVLAKCNIPRNTVVCDYHGELLTYDEGLLRYEQYGDNNENVYMFSFNYQGRNYWIDAVRQCRCHPKTRIKGRLLNHSMKTANVVPRIVLLNQLPHILFFAKQDIAISEEILFDYGVQRDRLSELQDWMLS